LSSNNSAVKKKRKEGRKVGRKNKWKNTEEFFNPNKAKFQRVHMTSAITCAKLFVLNMLLK
jgi:hypothetical protein